MDEYFIGAGALLTAGSAASITPATLHAQTGETLAGRIEAALIDFEAARPSEISRLLIVAAGWTSARFRAEVSRQLLSRQACSLADVIATLAGAKGVPEVHVFARWQLDAATAAELRERGVRILEHPLEAIGQVALVSGQRLERWRAPFRAA
ncbi:MAG: hypothetical protein WA814_08505 [Candidatus Baltobacteraceae bacterium]